MAKVSRDDELQADRYGLQLMSRAGYDPESMVTMMAHLAVLQNEHSDAVTKYLQDHPDPQNRVAHLMGYPELDPTVVTRRRSSSGWGRRARSLRFRGRSTALSSDPHSSEALLDLGRPTGAGITE
jgi:predicted Zn-dependent protease